jgi:hypothetical protein
MMEDMNDMEMSPEEKRQMELDSIRALLEELQATQGEASEEGSEMAEDMPELGLPEENQIEEFLRSRQMERQNLREPMPEQGMEMTEEDMMAAEQPMPEEGMEMPEMDEEEKAMRMAAMKNLALNKRS